MKRVWEEATESPVAEPPRPVGPRKRSLVLGLAAFLVFLLGVLAVVGVFLFGFEKKDLALTVLAKDKVE